MFRAGYNTIECLSKKGRLTSGRGKCVTVVGPFECPRSLTVRRPLREMTSPPVVTSSAPFFILFSSKFTPLLRSSFFPPRCKCSCVLLIFRRPLRQRCLNLLSPTPRLSITKKLFVCFFSSAVVCLPHLPACRHPAAATLPLLHIIILDPSIDSSRLD